MATNILYDKEFRNKMRDLDQESLIKLMTGSVDGIDVKVLTNTKDTFYFVIPDNNALDGGDLFDVQAAGKLGASTVGSHSTIGGCLATASSTLSSVSTAIGTASTVACK